MTATTTSPARGSVADVHGRILSLCLCLGAVVGLAGCTALLIPAEDYDEQVVVEIPAFWDTPGEVPDVLSARLDALGVPHRVERDDTRITVDYSPGERALPDAFFTAPGAVTVRPGIPASDLPAAAPACPEADLDEACAGAQPTGGTIALGAVAVPAWAFTGADAVESAGSWTVTVQVHDDAVADLDAVTDAAACGDSGSDRIGVLLDGSILAAPMVTLACGQSLGSEVAIAGDFTGAEAEALAALIGTRPMPTGTVLVSRD